MSAAGPPRERLVSLFNIGVLSDRAISKLDGAHLRLARKSRAGIGANNENKPIELPGTVRTVKVL